MRPLLFFALLLAAPALLSCQADCSPPEPTPSCYDAVVVGQTCMDGLLIDVNAAFPIGRPALSPDNKLLGRNVVAVLNARELGALPGLGQRLYFEQVADSSHPANELACYANDAIKTPIPHVVLRNVSATGCFTRCPR